MTTVRRSIPRTPTPLTPEQRLARAQRTADRATVAADIADDKADAAIIDAAEAQLDADAAQLTIDETLDGTRSFTGLQVEGTRVEDFLARTDGDVLNDPAAVPAPVIADQVRASLSATGDLTFDSGTGAFGLSLSSGSVTGALGHTPTSVTGLTGVQSVAAFKAGLTLVKADVGLSSVDNTADTAKPVSTAQQTALDLKAPLASPALTGLPTAPTAASSNNSTLLATTAFVQAVIADLIAMAPGTLNTLDELAAALGDDPNFAATVTTALATKLVKSNNLSDLTDASAARTNLGLGALATVTPGTGIATALAIAVGSAGAPVVLNGAGGTPSSLALINATNLPLSAVVASTSTALGVGSLEIGHASDTTLARSSAGNLTIEGNLIYRAGGTDVPVADGGTGSSTAAGARTNLGLGTIVTQDASTVALTGGSITGLTTFSTLGNASFGSASAANPQGWGRIVGAENSGSNGAAFSVKDSAASWTIASYLGGLWFNKDALTISLFMDGTNIGVRTFDFGSGSGVIGMANVTTVPTTNPTGGGVQYVENGVLKYRGSAGTVTTLGPA